MTGMATSYCDVHGYDSSCDCPRGPLGALTAREAPDDLDLGATGVQIGSHEPPAAVCAKVGHDWNGDGSECARCGKPSALPRVATCRHGAPLHWRPPHDCEYSDAREALIPYAEAAADRDVPEQRRVRSDVMARATPAARRALEAEADRRSGEWCRAFHAHMEALVRAARALGAKP